MFNSPNLANYSPYELVFGRKPKLLLDLEMDPDVKISGMHREYILQLRQRLEYLHKLLQDFQMKRLALINKDRELKQVQDLRNRIKFLSFYKLLPVNLTWLSQVYGKMFFFPIC